MLASAGFNGLIATAGALLPLMAWFSVVPPCLATLATIACETGGWRLPLITAGCLFALACATAFITYRVALAQGAG